MSKVKVFVKYAPITNNTYRYGVINTYNQYADNHFMIGLKGNGYIPENQSNFIIQGQYNHADGAERGIYFETQEEAINYASILQPYLESLRLKDIAFDKERKKFRKTLGNVKLHHIIPETWLTKIRVFLNV